MQIFNRLRSRTHTAVLAPGAGKDGSEPVGRTMRIYPPEAHKPSPSEQMVLAGGSRHGLCTVCGVHRRFCPFTDNARESGNCTRCLGSNRVRQMAWMLRREVKLPIDGKLVLPDGLALYNTESSGPLHEALKSHPGYQCSAYWGDPAVYGRVVDGVRNEDVQALSFSDGTFDIVLSSEVLEHVPDPYRAHREIHRVLKPGGRHIFTVPYGEAMPRDNVRASLVNGKIVHHAEALYHQDPIRLSEGILVWTIFGLEMLVKLDEIGFQTELWRLHEPEFGIMGSGAEVFVARKPRC